MQTLRTLLQKITSSPIESCDIIANSGSNRQYYRLKTAQENYIGVFGQNIAENLAFIALSAHFYKLGLPVPQVLAIGEDNLHYITKDLGEQSLFENLNDIDLLKKTIRLLPKFQFEGGQKLNYNICYPQAEFNERTINWDLNYFKYNFLKLRNIEFDEQALEDDFQHLSALLLQHNSNTFLYRDFQSRNVMVKDNEPFFIDFQGGRKGPIHYDVASFVYQAKANFSDETKNTLIQEYIEAANKYTLIEEVKFRNDLMLFVLFRNLQTLGAYGFRGLIEKKSHFIQSIPFALKGLNKLIKENEFRELPYLIELLKQLIESTDLNEEPDVEGLTVKVYSFSYKKGIPEDYSGNGGGYVFDCRAVHNPGRYTPYKKLTGKDKPVIKFLEKDGEISSFLEHAYALANASVSRYKERNFKHLMFSFGCTGGQHRSVYSAQKLAEYINEKFNVRVELEHREQDHLQNQLFDIRK